MLNNQHGKLLNDSKVTKKELLEVLEENLVTHRVDVMEALALRQDTMLAYFLDEANKLQEDGDYQPKETARFPIPSDNSKDYIKAIRMVEMTQDLIITLNENQFDRLVMDEWDWKESLVLTSSLYGKTI